MSRTFLNANAALGANTRARTFTMVDENFSVDFFYGKSRATPNASIAVQTFFFVPENLQARLLAFGIGAPSTFKRTTLEENNRPNSRSVIYAEFLNVEDHTVVAHRISSVTKVFQIILHDLGNVNKNFPKRIDLLLDT